MKQSNNNSKPHVLFLTHVGDPGGAELKTLRLCNAISDQCSFIHFQHGELENLLKKNNIKSDIIPMPDTMTGVKRDGGLKVLIKTIPAIFTMIGTLAKKEKEADIIVPVSQKAFIIAALTKIITRKPIIWLMNDLISPEYFSKPLIFAMTKIFAPFANKIVVNSQASYDAWKNVGGNTNKVIIIHSGSDVSAIDEQINDSEKVKAYRQKFDKNDAPLIGIFGRISHWKGQDIFIQALSQLENIQGVIVGGAHFGEDDYLKSLEKMIVTENIEDRVTFAGHINDVPCAMDACDVIVHASTQPEPFGGAIVEGMLVGKPVIASDAGGAQEIIVHNDSGLLTAVGDAKALSEAIKYYLDNPEQAKEISAKARTRAVDNFSKDIMISKFKDLLSQVS